MRPHMLAAARVWLGSVTPANGYRWHRDVQFAVLIRVALCDPTEPVDPAALEWLRAKSVTGDRLHRDWAQCLIAQLASDRAADRAPKLKAVI
jgi:hypothetical protein